MARAPDRAGGDPAAAAAVVKATPEAAKPLEREVASKKPEPEKPASRKPSAPAKVALNKEAPVPEARVPVPDKPPGEVDAARRKVAGIGLLAMKDDVQELHGAPMAVQLRTDIKQGPGVGTSTGVGVGAGNEAGVPTPQPDHLERHRRQRRHQHRGLQQEHRRRRPRRPLDDDGRRRDRRRRRRRPGRRRRARPGRRHRQRHRRHRRQRHRRGGNIAKGGGAKASRSIEDVRLVFERNKGSIYAIYNRALREEPGLQGKVVLKLTIAPEGNVVDVRIESSDLKTPELEAKLLARIRQFDFGAKDVNQMVVSYPVDFLPS